MSYKAPLKDFQFLLHHVLNASALSQTAAYEDSTPDILNAVLEEAAKFAELELAPLNRTGDEQGCKISNGEVTTPEGFQQAYRGFADGGWPGLSLSEEYGGQGLPHTLYTLVDEVVTTANPGFAMYRGLIDGAFNTLLKYASDSLKDTYLPKLASGEMLPTMNLTEPHCGSDLGLLRTRAKPNDDGSYCVTGTKIFITGGEHDLTQNILHLVLARLPDAPQGVRGISLFVVPKYYQDKTGNEIRNAVVCSGIEHKMGLKASATCVMNYEEAKGWLVGAPHTGLMAMFTMMNAARLAVGMQGVSCAEGTLQIAEAYAAERRQGTAPGSKGDGPDTIDCHPDVQRMLRTQKAFAQGGRALALRTAIALDLSHAAATEEDQSANDNLVQLLTPVVKAILTDAGVEAASLGIQVLGGHGYIREWGVEQWLRDIRIAPIYEGTNGIQALDLIGRKLTMNKGRLPDAYFQAAKIDMAAAKQAFAMASLGEEALASLISITQQIQQANEHQKAVVASDYLSLFGLVALAREWCVIAHVSLEKQNEDPAFYQDKLETAEFYLTRILPRYMAHLAIIKSAVTQ